MCPIGLKNGPGGLDAHTLMPKHDNLVALSDKPLWHELFNLYCLCDCSRKLRNLLAAVELTCNRNIRWSR